MVADGGTGALLTTLVSRLRCPEEANLKSPESVIAVHTGFIRAGAELIETNTFGANRRKLSAQFLDDQLEQIVETGVKLAREAREVSGAPVLIGGSIGPLGDLEHTTGAEDAFAVFHEQARLLEGRGVDLFLVETFYDLDELETAISGRAGRVVAADRRPAHLRRGRADAGRRARPRRGRAADGARRRAIGANCGLGPQAALAALAEMSETANGIPLSAQPNVGLPARSGGRLVYPNATPDYFAEFAAQARSLGAGLDRRLLWHVAGSDQRDPRRARGRPRAARRPARHRARRRRDGGAGGDADAAPDPARSGRMGRLGRARPAEGDEHGVDARRLRAAPGVGRRPRRRPERQPHGAGAPLGPHGRSHDRADGRARDDPARDAARLVRDGPAVAAPRRACGGRPQHPRGHRRPASRRGLPGVERRLRRGRDRPHDAGLPPQPRRGLHRQGDRRPDVLLRGRGRQPVRRRSRPRGGALPPERSTPARASR